MSERREYELALIERIRKELKQNQSFLERTNHYYALYQNRTYDQVYAWLDALQEYLERIRVDR